MKSVNSIGVPRALEELTTQIADDLREALTQISELTARR